MKSFSAAIVVGVLLSGSALAQTCANPIPVFSNNNGGAFAAPGSTTCGAANPFPEFPGGIASPQPDIVYTFTANAAAATTPGSFTVTTTAGGLIPGIIVLDACTDTANIVGSGVGQTAGSSATATLSGLIAGNPYFAVVTSKPGSPDANCGAFGGTINGNLPVSLQGFSVE